MVDLLHHLVWIELNEGQRRRAAAWRMPVTEENRYRHLWPMQNGYAMPGQGGPMPHKLDGAKPPTRSRLKMHCGWRWGTRRPPRTAVLPGGRVCFTDTRRGRRLPRAARDCGPRIFPVVRVARCMLCESGLPLELGL